MASKKPAAKKATKAKPPADHRAYGARAQKHSSLFVWLTPEVQALLEKLMVAWGLSKRDTIERCITQASQPAIRLPTLGSADRIALERLTAPLGHVPGTMLPQQDATPLLRGARRTATIMRTGATAQNGKIK